MQLYRGWHHCLCTKYQCSQIVCVVSVSFICVDFTCRERLGVPLSEDTALFFLVNDKTLVVLSTPMRQVYDTEKDEDGFLYIVYTSQPGMG